MFIYVTFMESQNRIVAGMRIFDVRVNNALINN